MKPASSNLRREQGTSGFTLVELMVATSIGVILAGTVVLLLIQAVTEQRHGYSDRVGIPMPLFGYCLNHKRRKELGQDNAEDVVATIDSTRVKPLVPCSRRKLEEAGS